MELFLADKKFADEYICNVGAECINLKGYLHEIPDAEIFTDDQKSGILILHDNTLQIHTKSAEFIEAALRVVKGHVWFCTDIEKFAAEYLLARYKSPWVSHCHILSYDKKEVPCVPVPDGVTVDSIGLKWAKLVNDNYTYRNRYSLRRIRNEITKRPSSAVYVDGKPVCWNLLHEDYSMGAMFSLPEYRRKGYAYIASVDLMKKVIAEGMTPYIQVIYDNYASLGLAAKLGFEKIFEAYWFEIKI